MNGRVLEGGTANDPVDITFSDSEASSSDAPRFIPSPTKQDPQSSNLPLPEGPSERAKDIEEEENVNLPSERASSSRTPMTSVYAVKRSRNSSPNRTPTQPVKKAKNTARKSTQHISTAQRLRWQAAQNEDSSGTDTEDVTHEEAMRQAAAERRRSQSARKTSISPKKESAPILPDTVPTSIYSASSPIRDTHGLGQTHFDDPHQVTAGSSSDSLPASKPLTAQMAFQAAPPPSRLGESRLDPLPQFTTQPTRPSPFQTLDEPGSWGHAVPMLSQFPSSRPRQSGLGSTAEASSSTNPTRVKKNSIKQAAVVPETSTQPEESSNLHSNAPPARNLLEPPLATPDVPRSTAAGPARQGPRWATSATPTPEPVILPLPTVPIEADELDSDFPMSLGDINPSTLVQQPGAVYNNLPHAGPSNPQPNRRSVTPGNQLPDLLETTVPRHSPKSAFARMPSPEPMLLDDGGILPLPGRAFSISRSPSLAPEQPETAPIAFDSSEVITQADKVIPPNRTDDVPPISDAPETEPIIGFASRAVDTEIPATAMSTLETMFSSSPAGDEAMDESKAVLTHMTAPEATDEEAVESLGDAVQEVDLGRSQRSSSSGSIEEIPPAIAMSQSIFARSADADASARLRRLQVAGAEVGPSEKATGPLRRSNIGIDADNIMPNAGPSRPSRLKIERAPSVSSSSNDSPSKRQSSRLASRALEPVYSFTCKYSPISWRKVVEMDGNSDTDAFLRSTPSSTPSTSSDVALAGADHTVSAVYTLPIIDPPPPPDRVSQAIRQFDTRLIDEWNRMSPTMTHNPALHRMIFESYIGECVQGSEPEIKVFNTVDMESIPPHFEFQYSNDMLYHADVPEPELGKGCDCEGGCGEKSKTCSCLKRQMLYNYGVIDGFAYDKNGQLKNPVSIWECGPNCGCPPECMNRVIQRGRGSKALVDLFKTKQKGWGVRARERIPAGTFLGIYSGEVVTEAESERRGMIYEKVGRTYLFDCDGWHIGNPPKGLEAVDPRLAELAYAAERRAKEASMDHDHDGLYNAYSIDAFHYGFTRFFNHSCDPNLQIVQAYVNDFHPERHILVIFTRHDVGAGQELCISYKGVPDVEEEEMVMERRTKRNGKTKKITKKKKQKTAVAHVSNKAAARKGTCFCGASSCDGIMFGVDN